ncbi:unnamed protein product [Protopolystoma xenopodis]|uniref:Uncharacterized protein n=1 Tax=Protopolystoma xenopodis TaxID=117903 RepID=A0A3S5BRQ2_9PLAT|nr:unnamed protein product [Protopolystoma xenopodis]
MKVQAIIGSLEIDRNPVTLHNSSLVSGEDEPTFRQNTFLSNPEIATSLPSNTTTSRPILLLFYVIVYISLSLLPAFCTNALHFRLPIRLQARRDTILNSPDFKPDDTVLETPSNGAGVHTNGLQIVDRIGEDSSSERVGSKRRIEGNNFSRPLKRVNSPHGPGKSD